MNDVEFLVSRKLSLMTMRTQVVGPHHFHRTDCGEYRLGSQLTMIERLLPAWAWNGVLVWLWKLQEFG